MFYYGGNANCHGGGAGIFTKVYGQDKSIANPVENVKSITGYVSQQPFSKLQCAYSTWGIGTKTIIKAR